MNKSHKSIAGYHLLMILSSVDHVFSPSEEQKIQEYLAENFAFKFVIENELEVIQALQPEAWKDHFEFHARCFLEDSTLEERKRFVDFAKTLIKLDAKVTDREHKFYTLLKYLWKLN